MADFLLGHMNNSEGQIGAPIANFRSNYLALYFQDTWKVTPKLTLELGHSLGKRSAVQGQA